MGIGENIIKMRERRNMSQSELARRIGVTRAAVSLWESGKNRPKMDKVEAMAGAFGVPVSSIIGGEYHYAVVDIPDMERERLLAAYSSMDDEHRRIALATVEAMAGVR